MERVKAEFPYFAHHPEAIYADSASTTQKPQAVVDAMNNYFVHYCANAGRGSYPAANQVTKLIAEVRHKVKDFINAFSADEIVFTSGATDSFTTVVFSWGLTQLKDGDEVMLCPSDHYSTILPWLNLQKILRSFGVHIKILHYGLTPAGTIDKEAVNDQITTKTKLIVLTHISNILGTKNDIQAVREVAGEDVVIVLDASQSIGHTRVDIRKLGVDFVVFSGHKMFASTGIGVLWVHPRLHASLSPHKVGGGMVNHWSDMAILPEPLTMPAILEAGTPNISGIASLGAAIDFINKCSIEEIEHYLKSLTATLVTELDKIPTLQLLVGAEYSHMLKYGIVSFRIAGLSSTEAGFIFAQHNIALRTGNHCSGFADDIHDSVRVSLHVYNTADDIKKIAKLCHSLASL